MVFLLASAWVPASRGIIAFLLHCRHTEAHSPQAAASALPRHAALSGQGSFRAVASEEWLAGRRPRRCQGAQAERGGGARAGACWRSRRAREAESRSRWQGAGSVAKPQRGRTWGHRSQPHQPGSRPRPPVSGAESCSVTGCSEWHSSGGAATGGREGKPSLPAAAAAAAAAAGWRFICRWSHGRAWKGQKRTSASFFANAKAQCCCS
jgi:hypothetical protein